MFRKFLTLVAAMTLWVGIAAESQAQTSPTIESIRANGKIRVGMADSLPAQAKNPATDTWEGYNVDMANNLAEVLDVELEIVDATWATLIPGLLAGQYDIVMADMFATPQRGATVVFTNAYDTLGFSFLVRDDLEIDTIEGLNSADITFSNLSGTASGPMIDQMFPEATRKDIPGENIFAPHLEVAAGRADVEMTDHVANITFLKNNPNAKVRLLEDGRQVSATGFAYAIAPGDYHFLRFLDNWIAYNQSTGLSGDIRMKWYGY